MLVGVFSRFFVSIVDILINCGHIPNNILILYNFQEQALIEESKYKLLLLQPADGVNSSSSPSSSSLRKKQRAVMLQLRDQRAHIKRVIDALHQAAQQNKAVLAQHCRLMANTSGATVSYKRADRSSPTMVSPSLSKLLIDLGEISSSADELTVVLGRRSVTGEGREVMGVGLNSRANANKVQERRAFSEEESSPSKRDMLATSKIRTALLLSPSKNKLLKKTPKKDLKVAIGGNGHHGSSQPVSTDSSAQGETKENSEDSHAEDNSVRTRIRRSDGNDRVFCKPRESGSNTDSVSSGLAKHTTGTSDDTSGNEVSVISTQSTHSQTDFPGPSSDQPLQGHINANNQTNLAAKELDNNCLADRIESSNTASTTCFPTSIHDRIFNATNVLDSSIQSDHSDSVGTRPKPIGNNLSFPLPLRVSLSPRSPHKSARIGILDAKTVTDDSLVSNQNETDGIVKRQQHWRYSSESDDSFTMSQNETSETSDGEGKLLALQEQLLARKQEAEKLHRVKRRLRRERLASQENALRQQIQKYDDFIQNARQDLEREMLDLQNVSAVRPVIKKPESRRNSRASELSLLLTSSEKSDVSDHSVLSETSQDSSMKISHVTTVRVASSVGIGQETSTNKKICETNEQPNSSSDSISNASSCVQSLKAANDVLQPAAGLATKHLLSELVSPKEQWTHDDNLPVVTSLASKITIPEIKSLHDSEVAVDEAVSEDEISEAPFDDDTDFSGSFPVFSEVPETVEHDLVNKMHDTGKIRGKLLVEESTSITKENIRESDQVKIPLDSVLQVTTSSESIEISEALDENTSELLSAPKGKLKPNISADLSRTAEKDYEYGSFDEDSHSSANELRSRSAIDGSDDSEGSAITGGGRSGGSANTGSDESKESAFTGSGKSERSAITDSGKSEGTAITGSGKIEGSAIAGSGKSEGSAFTGSGKSEGSVTIGSNISRRSAVTGSDESVGGKSEGSESNGNAAVYSESVLEKDKFIIQSSEMIMHSVKISKNENNESTHNAKTALTVSETGKYKVNEPKTEMKGNNQKVNKEINGDNQRENKENKNVSDSSISEDISEAFEVDDDSEGSSQINFKLLNDDFVVPSLPIPDIENRALGTNGSDSTGEVTLSTDRFKQQQWQNTTMTNTESHDNTIVMNASTVSPTLGLPEELLVKSYPLNDSYNFSRDVWTSLDDTQPLDDIGEIKLSVSDDEQSLEQKDNELETVEVSFTTENNIEDATLDVDTIELDTLGSNSVDTITGSILTDLLKDTRDFASKILKEKRTDRPNNPPLSTTFSRTEASSLSHATTVTHDSAVEISVARSVSPESMTRAVSSESSVTRAISSESSMTHAISSESSETRQVSAECAVQPPPPSYSSTRLLQLQRDDSMTVTTTTSSSAPATPGLTTITTTRGALFILHTLIYS